MERVVKSLSAVGIEARAQGFTQSPSVFCVYHATNNRGICPMCVAFHSPRRAPGRNAELFFQLNRISGHSNCKRCGHFMAHAHKYSCEQSRQWRGTHNGTAAIQRGSLRYHVNARAAAIALATRCVASRRGSYASCSQYRVERARGKAKASASKVARGLVRRCLGGPVEFGPRIDPLSNLQQAQPLGHRPS